MFCREDQAAAAALVAPCGLRQVNPGSVAPGQLDDETHAAMAQAFVKWLRRHQAVATFCEVPYNFYGERGVVDVVALLQPAPAVPWRGIACELKPVIYDLGATIRQVKKAERYFQLPPALSALGSPILRFPLILEANERNYLTALHYADVLDGVEVHFFSADTALANPFEQAWAAGQRQATPQLVIGHDERCVF